MGFNNASAIDDEIWVESDDSDESDGDGDEVSDSDGVFDL